jgi:hypothetical protein
MTQIDSGSSCTGEEIIRNRINSQKVLRIVTAKLLLLMGCGISQCVERSSRGYRLLVW